MLTPEGSGPIDQEEQRREGLERIDKELDLLEAQQNEVCDLEDYDKAEEIQAMIDEKKKERYQMMTDIERVSMFESKIDGHHEMAEMGLPVTVNTIAIDAWGDIPDSLSPHLQAELERIKKENDFIDGDE